MSFHRTVAIGQGLLAEDHHPRGFAGELAQVFQTLPARLEQQDEGAHDHRGRVAPVAPGAGQVRISQGTPSPWLYSTSSATPPWAVNVSSLR